MIFAKKTDSVETLFGIGRKVSGTVSVPWRRHRGVLINLVWNDSADPSIVLVNEISENLDSIVDAGLGRIGADEFPDHLRAVLPENIDLSESDGDFSLSFYCPDDEDYLIGVVFKDGNAVKDWEGH